MKIGLFNLMGLYDRNTSPPSVLRTTIDMIKMADDFGFDIAWSAEHSFTNHSTCPSALLMLARCVAETRQIRLGPTVLALPFYNPLRLVQEVAFAELLAGGRFVLGLGSGYQPYEFNRFGRTIADKSRIMLEVWDVLEQGLTQGFVEYHGQFVDVPRTELPMRPFGLSLPEVFVAGSHPEIVARTAAKDCTIFMSFGHRGLKPALAFRDILAER